MYGFDLISLFDTFTFTLGSFGQGNHIGLTNILAICEITQQNIAKIQLMQQKIQMMGKRGSC